VRRALSLAISRDKLVARVLQGGQQPALRFLPPFFREVPGSAAATSDFAADAATARQLLSEAGFAGGSNFPNLEVTSWVNNPALEAIQEMWRQELSLDIRIVVRDAKVHVAALQSGAYDIGFITAIPDAADPLNLLEHFRSDSPENYPRWTSARYDALLAEAEASRQPGFLIAAAETLLASECPVAPLYYNTQNWLMNSRVKNWRADPFWTRDYTAVTSTSVRCFH